MPSIALFVDLAKAFDSIPHDLLLKALESVGFRGTPYNIMKDYLSNRYQRVKVGDKLSDLKDLINLVSHREQFLDRCYLIYT